MRWRQTIIIVIAWLAFGVLYALSTHEDFQKPKMVMPPQGDDQRRSDSR